MIEYFVTLQNEIGFYYNVLKITFYFFIGASFLIILNNIKKLFNFLFSKFSIKKLVNQLNFIFKLIVFMLVSTLIGWIIIFVFF